MVVFCFISRHVHKFAIACLNSVTFIPKYRRNQEALPIHTYTVMFSFISKDCQSTKTSHIVMCQVSCLLISLRLKPFFDSHILPTYISKTLIFLRPLHFIFTTSPLYFLTNASAHVAMTRPYFYEETASKFYIITKPENNINY